MGDIALVTANFDGIDDIKVLPLHKDVDAFYYTDERTLKRADKQAVASWTAVVVPNYPRHDFNSRLRSRYFKHQIHRLDEVQQHQWLTWADGSLQMHALDFMVEAVAQLRPLAPNARMLVVPHPERRTVREEYDYIQGKILQGSKYHRIRYGHEKMTEQMAHYQERGWDVDAPGLWCGTFWVVENSELFRRCWNDWWDQNIRFGMMDQLSLPVVLRQHGCTPQILNVPLRQNAHFTHAAHQRNI
jgi:hypothetical protein